MMAAVCLLLLIASAATAPATDEGTAAFCQHASSSSSSSAAADYPSTSTSPNLPFVWDAHYNAVSGLVELTAASRKPCAFNRARWKEACSRFPQYSKQLAGCDDGKVLLDVPEAVPVVGQSPETIYDEVEDALPLERLFGGQMACVYSRRGKPVYQMLSQPVQGRKLWLMMGAFQVRCPEPREFVVVNGSRLIASRNPVAWDSVALRRLDGTGRFKEGPVSTAAKASSGSATTASFSVCSAAEATYADHRKRPVGDPLDLPRPTVTSTKRSSRRRLSVCAVANSASTSSRSNSRTLLVEWLEYHLSVGVEHLYLYDMSRRRTGQRLADLLTDYVAAGVVTIVPWPYQSCVDGMAAEKSVQWMHDERQYAVTFQVPASPLQIQHWTAGRPPDTHLSPLSPLSLSHSPSPRGRLLATPRWPVATHGTAPRPRTSPTSTSTSSSPSTTALPRAPAPALAPAQAKAPAQGRVTTKCGERRGRH